MVVEYISIACGSLLGVTIPFVSLYKYQRNREKEKLIFVIKKTFQDMPDTKNDFKKASFWFTKGFGIGVVSKLLKNNRGRKVILRAVEEECGYLAAKVAAIALRYMSPPTRDTPVDILKACFKQDI